LRAECEGVMREMKMQVEMVRAKIREEEEDEAIVEEREKRIKRIGFELWG